MPHRALAPQSPCPLSYGGSLSSRQRSGDNTALDPVDSEELQAAPANEIATEVAVDPEGPESYPEPELSLPQSIAEILNQHLTFELECIDRMYRRVACLPCSANPES